MVKSETVFVWVSVIDDQNAPILAHELVRLGFVVRPLINKGILNSEGHLGAVVNISVEMETAYAKREFASFVEETIAVLLDEAQIAYTMLLVTEECTVARWNSGNIPKKIVKNEPFPSLFEKKKLLDEKLN